MIATILITALAQIASGPSTATSPTMGASAITNGKPLPASTADTEKLVCRVKVPVGRRIGERECLSKADWKTYDAATNTRFGNYAIGGGQGSCLPTEPCRNGPQVGAGP